MAEDYNKLYDDRAVAERTANLAARLKLAEEVCEVFRHYHLSDGDDSAVTYEDIVDRMLAWERIRDKAKGSG